MFLAEKLKALLNASIAYDQSNANMGKKLLSNFAQNHITSKKEQE